MALFGIRAWLSETADTVSAVAEDSASPTWKGMGGVGVSSLVVWAPTADTVGAVLAVVEVVGRSTKQLKSVGVCSLALKWLMVPMEGVMVVRFSGTVTAPPA